MTPQNHAAALARHRPEGQFAEAATPARFLDAVKLSFAVQDTELRHSATDRLMEEALISLGFGEGVELIRSQTRWYA